MTDQNKNSEAYDIVWHIYTQTLFEKYIVPSNVVEQKRLFFESKIYEPVFSYADLPFDAQESIDLLHTLKITGVYERLLLQRAESLILQLKMLLCRGDKEAGQELSVALYDLPSEELIRCAHDIASMPIPRVKPVKISFEEAIHKLDNALRNRGFVDWRVKTGRNMNVTVFDVNREIVIPRMRAFTEKEIQRLIHHEIDVHVTRAVNGYSQNSLLFALGFPGYTSTEEGLALFMEEKTDTINPHIFRQYALRVIAVDMMLNGKTFREVYTCMYEYTHNKDISWKLALRVFRGGGYARDHIYLKGYYEVKEFLEAGGNIETLFVGKIGVGDVEFVEKLLSDRRIKQPIYLPMQDILS